MRIHLGKAIQEGRARLPYVCMCFGWFQELLEEERVPDFSAAVRMLSAMLDRGGMIVHVYRATDEEHAELIGRHRRLRSLDSGSVESGFVDSGAVNSRGAHSTVGYSAFGQEAGHEIERFLLDAASFRAWADALKRDVALEQRWKVIDLWPFEEGDGECFYGRATLIPGPTEFRPADSRPPDFQIDELDSSYSWCNDLGRRSYGQSEFRRI
jgi:hypothetical protein